MDLIKLESKANDQESLSNFAKKALRLDYIMTYYQLNCLLVDYFDDPDYFARNSKVEVIIDNKPTILSPSVMPEMEHKLKLL
jgi:hypothetical protein